MITDIEVAVPVRTAYDQWTQFEDFPLFMDHVSNVEQQDDTHVHFSASIAGVSREWVAEIVEQTRDQRIAWEAVDGVRNAGVVTFHPLADDRTRIVLQLEMDPEGLLEQVADKGGFVSDRAAKDLAAFKTFIENRGHAMGGYRRTVKRDPDHDLIRRQAEYAGLPKRALLELARERGLEGRAQMTKAELIDELVS